MGTRSNRRLTIQVLAAAFGAVGLLALLDMMSPDASAPSRQSFRNIARAQTWCGSNCSAGGTGRIMTADSDPAQLMTGMAQPASGRNYVQLATGPFILTGAMVIGDSYTLFIDGSGGACSSGTTLFDVVGVRSSTRAPQAVLGIRFPIAQGQILCAMQFPGTNGGGSVRWTGFRPYP